MLDIRQGMWYVDKHFWVIRTSQLSPWVILHRCFLRQLLLPRTLLDLPLSRHSPPSPWLHLGSNGYVWPTCPHRNPIWHLLVFLLVAYPAAMVVLISKQTTSWTPAESLGEKMLAQHSSFSLTLLQSFSLLSQAHLWLLPLFRSPLFYYAWKIVEATDSLLLVISRLLCLPPGSCCLASQGTCWPSVAPARFRRYVFVWPNRPKHTWAFIIRTQNYLLLGLSLSHL